MIKLLRQFFGKKRYAKSATLRNDFNSYYPMGYVPELNTLRAPYTEEGNRQALITAIRSLLGYVPTPEDKVLVPPINIAWQKNGKKAVLSRIKRLVQEHLCKGEEGLAGYSDELLAYLYIGLLESHLHIPMGIYGYWVEGEGIIEALHCALEGPDK